MYLCEYKMKLSKNVLKKYLKRLLIFEVRKKLTKATSFCY